MKPRDGWIGWLCIAAVVGGWDLLGLRTTSHETLSEYAGRHLPAAVIGCGFLALHFAGLEKLQRFDPLHLLAERLSSCQTSSL